MWLVWSKYSVRRSGLAAGSEWLAWRHSRLAPAAEQLLGLQLAELVDVADEGGLHRGGGLLAQHDAGAVFLVGALEARGEVHAIAHRGVILVDGLLRHEGAAAELASDPLIAELYLGVRGHSRVAS